MSNEAIGILFGADVGDVNSGSYKEIRDGIGKVVVGLAKDDVTKIKFNIDINHFNEQIKPIKKQIEELSKKASAINKNSGKSQTNNKTDTSALKEAKKTIKEYYDLQTKFDRKSSRTINASEEYEDLAESLKNAKTEFEKLIKVSKTVDGKEVIKLKEDIEGISEAQRQELDALFNSQKAKYATSSVDITKNAQQSWSNLTQKVHDYVDKVEYAASRDQKAADGLKELREMANSTDYHGYDALKAKLAEVEQHINANSLATETWGQKMLKTFGSRVRSALAGIITANIGKWLNDIYQNVIKLDEAIVNLQIASGKNREEIKAMTKEYAKLAQQLGATTIEVAEAADAWLRQGYENEDANTLIRNSTMLAKLGQMEAAEASTALTSAMKGYNVTVEDSINIVDKFTKVDMEAAASAGDIATAMAETSASANLANVSMDKLIGYITIVKEVTQDGAESVGTFYKTLFARMNNVAAGNFIDDETGESLNDVEIVLNRLGIALRNANGEFRNSSEVLDEVASRWSTFDNVAQHAIATAFAGTRQQEKFIVLMQNYGKALDYANSAASSSGTAMEKYGAYTDGLNGKLKTLTAAFEEFSATVLESDLVAAIIDILTATVNGLNSITAFGNKFVVTLALVSVSAITTFSVIEIAAKKLGVTLNMLMESFTATLKNPITYMSIILSMFLSFKDEMNSTSKIIVGAITLIVSAASIAFVILKTKAVETAGTISAAIMGIPVFGWIVAIIEMVIIAVVALASAFKDLQEKNNKQRAEALAAAKAIQDEADALKETADAAAEAADNIKALSEEMKTLQEEGEEMSADEWAEKIESLGAEISKMYSDKHLTTMQAINLLLDEELTYNELINATMAQRVDILNDINTGIRKNALDAAKEAYEKQKVANEQLKYALTEYGYDVFKKDDAWGDISESEIQSANIEAAEIASGIDGLNIYTKNNNQNSHIQITASTMEEYVSTLKEAVGAYEERYKYNLGKLSENAIYQYLYNALEEAENALLIQHQALGSVLEQVAASKGSELSVKFDKDSSKEEAKQIYDQTVDEVIDLIKNDTTISDAIANGLLGKTSEEHDNTIREYAEEYVRKYHTELFNAANAAPAIVIKKSAKDILDEVQEGFDGISDAMSSLTSEGYLTADALSTLFELESKNALAGLKLEEILIKDANGYKFAGNALEEYVNALIAQYTITEAFASLEDKEAAISKLETLRAVLATLMHTQDDATDSSQSYRDELEKQKEAYDDQLNAYKELIDIRKDILKTYEEELSYQKELEKRQRNVTKLQTKLAIARLDTSAAGQARVRELEEELRNAQDELEDFTLEHAIDVLTNQLDSQYAEYEAFIQGKLDEISSLIEGLDVSPEVNVDTSWMADALKSIEDLIIEISNKEVVSTPNDTGNTGTGNTGTGGIWRTYQDAVNAGYGSKVKTEEQYKREGLDKPTVEGQTGLTYEQYLEGMYNALVKQQNSFIISGENADAGDKPSVNEPPQTLNLGADYAISGLGNSLLGKDTITVTLNKNKYKVKASHRDDARNIDDHYSKNEWNDINRLFGGEYPGDGRLALYNHNLYVSECGRWLFISEKDTESLKEEYRRILSSRGNIATHHTGGFVGETPLLKSNEEFAKLLNGELVSTPAQMDKFMKKTLPSLMGITFGSGTTEFNAPLIAVTCGDVTSESLPKLEQVVNDAVKEIKKQLDSGMSRAGHKKTTKKLLL